jgi:hypothetical protein
VTRAAAALLLAWSVARPAAAAAQDASIEVTQAALTKLVQRIGPFSDAGVYKPSSPAAGSGLFRRCEFAGYLECPSRVGDRELRPLVRCEPKPSAQPRGGKVRRPALSKIALVPAAEPAVTYEWWIEGPALAVGAGSMTFTASVRARVGAHTTTETRTVPASLGWDAARQQLRLSVGAFVVPLRSGQTTIASVDVARFYDLTMPVQPQDFRLPLPDGSSRNIAPRPAGASVQYQPGKVVLNLALGL